MKGAIDGATNERLCCKLFDGRTYSTKELAREVRIHAALKHPNIVELKNVVRDSIDGVPKFGLVLERMEGGELFSEVVETGGLSEQRARGLFRQLMLGVAYCHSRQVAHGSLKLEDMLLSANRQVLKVGDFGDAMDVSPADFRPIACAGKYAAPEVQVYGDGSPAYDALKADVWSCGIALLCMSEGKFPRPHLGWSPPPGYNPEFHALVSKLLATSPAGRYTANDALKDPWVLMDESSPWTVEHVDAMLNGIDSSPLPKESATQIETVTTVAHGSSSDNGF